MKLSIIIPVYRTESTLSRCLDSILRQSFTDYEIILVDDGSPDECPHICDEYAQREARILVIHQKNGGLSDARNAGIQKAQGEYITFVDSDDTLVDNTLEKLMKELQDSPHVDILEYPVLERFGNKNRQTELTFTPREYTEPLDYWLGEKAYHHTYAWNKIYKRQLFIHVAFPKGKTFEDVWTTPLLIGLRPYDPKGNRNRAVIKVTNQGKYVYHWNNQGITAKAKYEDLKSLYDGHTQILDSVMETIKAHPAYLMLYQEPLQDYMAQILNILLDLYDTSGQWEPTPPLIGHLAYITQKQQASPYPISTIPVKLKLLNILGYQRLCKLNHLIHQIRHLPQLHW